MKPTMTTRRKAAVLAACAALAVGLGGAAQAGPRTFGDCNAMHAGFPYGVARTANAAAHPFPFWIRIRPPAVDLSTYTANRKLDRDNDGIACEVAR
jgi:hypothetical protein